MNKLKKEDKNQIKKILKELNIQFDVLRTNTEIIYMLEYSPKEFQKHFDAIPILLMYISEQKILIAICPNIYKMKKGDSTINMLYALNNTNQKLSSGNVTLNKNHIMYKYQEHFEKISSITKDKLESIFNDIVAASIFTCEEIKRIKLNEK